MQFQRFIYKIERHHFHMFEISGIDELTILEMIEIFLHSVILLTKLCIDLRISSPKDGMFKFTNISLALFQVGRFSNLLKLLL